MFINFVNTKYNLAVSKPQKYQAENRYVKTLILNRSTDQDIIDYIEGLDNFTGTVKKLF